MLWRVTITGNTADGPHIEVWAVSATSAWGAEEVALTASNMSNTRHVSTEAPTTAIKLASWRTPKGAK